MGCCQSNPASVQPNDNDNGDNGDNAAELVKVEVEPTVEKSNNETTEVVMFETETEIQPFIHLEHKSKSRTSDAPHEMQMESHDDNFFQDSIKIKKSPFDDDDDNEFISGFSAEIRPSGTNGTAIAAVITLTNTEARKLYMSKKGTRDPPSNFTLHESNGFPGVAVVGVKHWQKGMIEDGVIVNGQFYNDLYEASSSIVPMHDKWNTGILGRETATLAFVKQVACSFHLVMDESEAEVTRSMPQFMPAYHRPQVTHLKGDEISIVLWVRWKEDSDNVDHDNLYREFDFRFKSDGRCGKPIEIGKREVEIKNRDLVH